MSAASSVSGRRSRPTTEPPKRSATERARSAWRLAMKIVATPRAASAWAVSSLVSPAPMTTTGRPPSSPSSRSASSTATEERLTWLRAIAVSARTRLPVCSAAPNSRFDSGPVVPVSRALSWARLT